LLFCPIVHFLRPSILQLIAPACPALGLPDASLSALFLLCPVCLLGSVLPFLLFWFLLLLLLLGSPVVVSFLLLFFYIFFCSAVIAFVYCFGGCILLRCFSFFPRGFHLRVLSGWHFPWASLIGPSIFLLSRRRP